MVKLDLEINGKITVDREAFQDSIFLCLILLQLLGSSRGPILHRRARLEAVTSTGPTDFHFKLKGPVYLGAGAAFERVSARRTPRSVNMPLRSGGIYC